MPVPTIDPKTSVLALTEGQSYYIEFTATESPTSWAITEGALPTGLSFDTTDGRITGTPDTESAGSVYKIHVTATNATGTSAELVVVMGVERATITMGAAVEVDVSIRNGAVTLPLLDEFDIETGMPIMHAKTGDVFPLDIGWVKNGYPTDITAQAFAVTAKEFEGESAYTLSTGSWRQVGTGLGTRYLVVIDLSAAALESIAGNYEGDKDTFVDMVCEIEAEYFTDVGTATPLDSTRTSQHFILRLHRDLG